MLKLILMVFGFATLRLCIHAWSDDDDSKPVRFMSSAAAVENKKH